MGCLMYERHYRVHLSYDLTLFQILGQKFVKFFVGILVLTMTPKGHFKINWPLVWSINFTSFWILFLAGFCYLAQLRVRVAGLWGRGRAEAEDVSRGRYARHCRLTLLSCLEPILPPLFCYYVLLFVVIWKGLWWTNSG